MVCFSVIGSGEMAAMTRVIANLPDNPPGQVPDWYYVREVLNHTHSSMDPELHSRFAQLL